MPAQIVTVVGATLFALILCEWRPWQLFARAGFSSNFYDVQAQAFLRRRLAVPAEVAGIEGFLIDGTTYLYYGPVPRRRPASAALFGSWTEGRITSLSMIVGFVALCTVTFHLARRVGAFVGAPARAPWRPALLVAAVACSPALALASEANVYNETELWAFVLILSTFVALIDLLTIPSRRVALFAGAAAALTVLTRVSVGLGAVTTVVLCAALLWRRERRLAVIAVAVAASGVVLHVMLNLARFGTLFDLPGDRQVLSAAGPRPRCVVRGQRQHLLRARVPSHDGLPLPPALTPSQSSDSPRSYDSDPVPTSSAPTHSRATPRPAR